MSDGVRSQLRAASSSPNEMKAPGGSIASRNPMSTRNTLISSPARPRAEQGTGVVQQRAAADELASDAEGQQRHRDPESRSAGFRRAHCRSLRAGLQVLDDDQSSTRSAARTRPSESLSSLKPRAQQQLDAGDERCEREHARRETLSRRSGAAQHGEQRGRKRHDDQHDDADSRAHRRPYRSSRAAGRRR